MLIYCPKPSHVGLNTIRRPIKCRFTIQCNWNFYSLNYSYTNNHNKNMRIICFDKKLESFWGALKIYLPKIQFFETSEVAGTNSKTFTEEFLGLPVRRFSLYNLFE